MSVRTFVAPSRILFTDSTGTLENTPLAADPHVCEQYRKLRARGECPRLQVVEKDGYYFTLNNTKLCLFRWLEKEGYCRRVRLERVPLKEVPESVQGLMVPPPLTPTNNNVVKECEGQACSPCSSEASRTLEDASGKGHSISALAMDRSDSGISSSSSSGSVGAMPLAASKPVIDEVDEDDETESLETGQTQESDSEFDWSDDISASTDDDSTSEEDGNSDDDEEDECNEKDKLLQ